MRVTHSIGPCLQLAKPSSRLCKILTKESLTCALRPAQSGAIWHLLDIAFVTYAGKCLPTRHPRLSWAPVPWPLCTAMLAVCQRNGWALLLLSFTNAKSAKPADITCQAQQWATWSCGFCHLFPTAAGKESSKFKPFRWFVKTWKE